MAHDWEINPVIYLEPPSRLMHALKYLQTLNPKPKLFFLHYVGTLAGARECRVALNPKLGLVLGCLGFRIQVLESKA